MKKTFYSHLVEVQIIEGELDKMDLSPEEKKELLHHVDSSIHYTVLDVVLIALPEEHKKTFIDHLNNEKHDAAWEHLLKNTVGIEEKIRNSTSNLLSEFLEDIRKVKLKA